MGVEAMSSNQLEEASLLLELQTEKILPAQNKMIEKDGNISDPEHSLQGNCIMVEKPSNNGDSSTENNTVADFPKDNTLGKAQDLPVDTLQQLDKSESVEVTKASGPEVQSDTAMEIDSEEGNSVSQPQDQNSQHEITCRGDKNATGNVDTIQISQSENGRVIQTEEFTSAKQSTELTAETPAEARGVDLGKSTSGVSDLNTQEVENSQILASAETGSQENSFDAETNAYKSSPGVISFDNMDVNEESPISTKSTVGSQENIDTMNDSLLPEEMEMDKVSPGDKSENDKYSTECHGSNDVSAEGVNKDVGRSVMSEAFGELESQNDSIDEDSDGRLLIDTEAESENDEDLSRRRRNNHCTESPLAAEKLSGQQHRDSPLNIEKAASQLKEVAEVPERRATEKSNDVISDKDVMLESVTENESESRSEPVRRVRSPVEEGQGSVEDLTDGGPKITTTRTPLGAVIKVEQTDEGYGDSGTGDILDILHKPEKTTTSEAQKRKHSDMNDKDVAQALSFDPTEVAKRVKKEPVDIFDSSKSNCSLNISPMTSKGFVPHHSSRPQESVSDFASSSLLQLSKQVDNIASQQNQQKAPTLNAVGSASLIQQQPSMLRHQLNSSVRFPPKVSRISIPFVRTQGPVLPATTQSDLRIRSVVPHPPSSSTATTATTTSAGGSSGKTQPVLITTQTRAVPSLMNSTSTFRYKIVPNASGGQSLVSASTVPSVSKPPTTVPSTSNSSSTSSLEAMSSSSINIDTVGMQTITELIARKNPLPNYKVTPPPPNLKVNTSVFTCYECGDTFRFSTSLETHRGRCSMKITYKCEECKALKIFFNKCQFLSHLRGHLNIEKTQAVPIHIKSDSISIEPLPKSHQQVFFQKFSVSTKTINQKVSKRCAECGIRCSQAEFEKHFYGEKKADGGSILGKWKCFHCKLHFPSICSQRAHARLHKEEELDRKFTCPECGIDLAGLMIGYQQFDDFKEKLSYHLINVCFHLDKVDIIVCSKCNAEFSSIEDFRFHYFQKLEQYFKCNVCPMAFRQQDSFSKHLTSQHSDIQSGYRNNKKIDVFKVIYRCHVCGSLIDDRFVLDNHLQQHAIATKSVYRCKECPRIFPSGGELASHFKEDHPEKMRSKMCKKCDITFDAWKDLLNHTLRDVHINPTISVAFQYCGTCGFFYDPTESDGGHSCMSQKTGKMMVNKLLNTCRICNERKFYSTAGLRNHLQTHQEKGYLVCKYCQIGGFSSVEEMKMHESICSNGKTLVKPNILRQKKSTATSSSNNKKMEKDAKNLKQPQLPVNLQPTFSCPDCDEKFHSKADLGNHRKDEHSDLFPCHLCGLTYESQQSLRKHLRVSHEGKTHVYPCVICRKRGIRRIFTNVLVLEKHLASKHRVSKNQMSSSIVNEIDEENEILDPPPKSIKSSSESTELITETDSPVKRLHIEGDQVFNCAKCRFGCENREEFLKHLEIHKIDNSVQCLECGLCFAIIPSLRKHLFMVHKVKDFEEYCQKEGISVMEEEFVSEEPEDTSYTSPAEESDIEDEERDPLECRVCYRTFEDENKLRTHMRSHGMAFIRNKRRERALQKSRQSASTSSVKSENTSENSNASLSDAK
ncbi:zinc finger protein 532-like [Saccostrea echinata]|uniref:zinc finger protein 532-like n=1 Tax=Saccostrea echinata TaxID=191078 RepID=UPI002A83FD9A|nr:zinc finger protein 532-like [Saccostrea echinata]